jgi:hypothetical protein
LPSGDGSSLACPRCDRPHSEDDRFCIDCGMPLVLAEGGEQRALGEAHEWARKIKPQYSRGRLVRITTARQGAEAEMLQGMLLEEGIPSLARRTRGFDVPDFLAAGPRDILVPEAAEAEARALLGLSEAGSEEQLSYGPSPLRLLLGILAVGAVGLVLLFLLELLNR